MGRRPVLRRRKFALLTITIVLTCFATSEQLVNATYQITKPLLQPPGKTAEKENLTVLKRLPVRLTAYYGPRRGQRKYACGNFRKDIRKNGSGKVTRSGKVPKIGMAAADWRVLPSGTRFRILECSVMLGTEHARPVSEMVFEVEDTGGGVKGRHVDIFTGFGDQGLEIAEKINDLQPKKFVIEVVEACQP